MVGVIWTHAFILFVTKVAPRLSPADCAVLMILAIAGWFLGRRAPLTYYRIREAERALRLYRCLGIPQFKRWMLDGDYLNAELRKAAPYHRVVSAHRRGVRAYAERTVQIERPHLEWLLVSLPFVAFTLLTHQWSYALYFFLLTLVTNLWPIFLQRFNRARCERALRRRK